MIADNNSSTSVVVPVYNVQDYLDRCMTTILGQTVPFEEIILVDDGSTDNSGAICDAYSKKHPQIRVIHKENGGLSSARNAGIALTSTPYITFVDSDDWIGADYLRTLLAIMGESNADMAMCGMRRMDAFDDTWQARSQEILAKQYTGEEFMRIMLRLDGNRTVHYACGKLYKKELLDDDHFPEGILNEDVESGFKAILHANCVVETRVPLYYYYQNPNGITGSRFGQNYLNLTNVWERVYNLAVQESPQWSEAARLNLMRADFTILCDSLIHGDIGTDAAYADEIEEHLKSLRGNLFQLLKSPIALNRRVLIAIIGVLYKPILKCVRLSRRGSNNA